MTTHLLEEKLGRYFSYLAEDKKNVNLLLSISDCYRALSDWVSAQRYLDDAIRASGQPFWTHQGFLYQESNQMPLAKEAFTLAVTEEDTTINRYNLGFCLYLTFEFSQALSTLNTPKNNQPPPLYTLLTAKILHHLQRIEDAITLLEQLLIQHESEPEAAGLLALLHFDNHNEERAELFANLSLALSPNNYDGKLVSILLKTVRNEVTLAEIESLRSVNPEDGRLLYALGTTHMRHMNFPAAEQAFFQISQIWPFFYENWIRYGWCHLLQDNLEKAEWAYQQAVIIDEKNADGWGGLALASALRNHMIQSEKWLEKAHLFDSGCFLAAITRIILANHIDPEQACKQFNTSLPEIASEINTMLSRAIHALNANEKITH